MRYWCISFCHSICTNYNDDSNTCTNSDPISNSMQPRPIVSRTMAPHHQPPLQEVLGHGHPLTAQPCSCPAITPTSSTLPAFSWCTRVYWPSPPTQPILGSKNNLYMLMESTVTSDIIISCTVLVLLLSLPPFSHCRSMSSCPSYHSEAMSITLGSSANRQLQSTPAALPPLCLTQPCLDTFFQWFMIDQHHIGVGHPQPLLGHAMRHLTVAWHEGVMGDTLQTHHHVFACTTLKQWGTTLTHRQG